VAPEIFFGRDGIVSDFASLILRNQQTKLAILGTGGIGKTSTALHILHHQDVVDRYNNHRYFVGCDAATSAESLATLILRIIQSPSVAGENILTVLHRALLAAPLTLLLLDNFESVWDISSGRDLVLDLLQKIGNARHVSLMITMRGTVPPAGIIWTRFKSLPPLSPADAKNMFLAINPSLDNAGCEGEQDLDMLLAEMDYIPLAVRLLAQVCIGFSSKYMLTRWREERTAMLRTHDVTPGKLESIEVSISLSLATLELTSNPDAVQLLSILCQLPDGLQQWEEQMPLILTGSGLQNYHHLVHLLHKTALLYIMGSRLKVLSPIRHFINHHHQASSEHTLRLENYFWELIDTCATTPLGPDFLRIKEIMEPEIGNIRSLIRNAIKRHPSADLVDTVLKVSDFLLNTVPSTELLDTIIVLVKEIGSPIQQAWVSEFMGWILLMQAKYTEASDTLQEARRQFLEIGDVLGAARCFRGLGDILRMQAKYIEASDTLTEARRQFLEIGDVLGAAYCSKSLGNILNGQAKYTEAFDTLTEARRQFLEIGDIVGAAECFRSLGDILLMQGKYTEAFDTLTEARRQFLEIGDVLGAAYCSKSLGNILNVQAKYTEASDTLTEARRQFLEIGDVHGVAQCLKSLGNILRMQAKYIEASDTLTEARRQFLEIGDVLGTAQCFRSFGDILRMQGKYTEAFDTLTEARRQFLEIGDVHGAAQCFISLGDILRMQGKYTEAFDTLTEARRQFLQIGDVHSAAQCLKSLGDILYGQAKYSEAFDNLTESRRQFLEIGDVHSAIQCSSRLGYVLHMQGKYTEAFDTWTEARCQFLEIGDVVWAADCSQRLNEVQMRASQSS
jgi:tetratricopeptide (TPR) repeat protein